MSDDKRIDGHGFAERLRGTLKDKIKALKADHQITPHLCVIIVGDDPASAIYVRRKGEQAEEIGMRSTTLKFPSDLSQADLLAEIERLNYDPSVHGILVQMPLPDHISSLKVIDAIDPLKDVDGFHILNAGKLSVGLTGLVPCTPLGAMMLLQDSFSKRGLSLSGQHAVVVGRSNIVGKPMAQMLLKADCTVTITHSRTRDLQSFCKAADILVAAIGRPHFIKGDWVKKGATVIDVGINRIEVDGKSKIVGDVDYEAALSQTAAITPVPKGVGPMTIACLLQNTLTATRLQHNLAQEP